MDEISYKTNACPFRTLHHKLGAICSHTFFGKFSPSFFAIFFLMGCNEKDGAIGGGGGSGGGGGGGGGICICRS